MFVVDTIKDIYIFDCSMKGGVSKQTGTGSNNFSYNYRRSNIVQVFMIPMIFYCQEKDPYLSIGFVTKPVCESTNKMCVIKCIQKKISLAKN